MSTLNLIFSILFGEKKSELLILLVEAHDVGEGSDRHLDAYTSHSISIWGEDYPPIHMGPLEYSEAVDRDTEETLEDLLGPFPALRLRGLPFDAGVRDVITFFHVSYSS